MKLVLPYKIKILFISLFLTTLFVYPSRAQAATSCTANVSPSSITANSTGNVFTFTVSNTGDTAVSFVTIRRPSDDFTLNNIGVPGWTVGATSALATLSDGNISPGNSTDFIFHVDAGPNEVSSTNWGITVGPGGSEISCTGSLGTAISGTIDTTPPVITNIAVSDITNSSVKVSWTTNEASDSSIGYDTDSSFGTEQRVNSATMTTTHSLSVTSLTASTAYYYFVESTDASNNTQSEEGDLSTFTTAATVATTAPTPTPTTITVTAAPAATATPVPVEKVSPVVSITTTFEEPFEQAPNIEGRAIDNVGVSSIDFSIDGGRNWLPVDFIGAVNAKSTSFSFVPVLFEDGNYKIQVRALDVAGNKGVSETEILVIDRLPPRVGGNLISLGPQPLVPNKDGVIVTLAGLEQKITISAVGGPITIDLHANGRMFSLVHSSETGLWNGVINFSEPGIYQLVAKAKDGAGNTTERKLNTVVVLRSGTVKGSRDSLVVTKGRVMVFVQDQQTKIWTNWDAKSFGQVNPQEIDEKGNYEFFLPPGKYFVQIKSPGKAKLTSRIFNLTASTPINSDFELQDARQIVVGPVSISLPTFSFQKIQVTLITPETPSDSSLSELVGTEAPLFDLPTQDGNFSLRSLRGKTSVITFVASWSPPSVEQISVIDKAVASEEIPAVIVSSQEISSKVTIFKNRGSYDSQIVIDRDGDLVDQYALSSFPTHYFLDRKGVIKEIVTGVLNVEEMKEVIHSI